VSAGDAGVAVAPAVPLSPGFQRGRFSRAALHRVERAGDAAVSDIGLAVDSVGVHPEEHGVEVVPVLVSARSAATAWSRHAVPRLGRCARRCPRTDVCLFALAAVTGGEHADPAAQAWRARPRPGCRPRPAVGPAGQPARLRPRSPTPSQPSGPGSGAFTTPSNVAIITALLPPSHQAQRGRTPTTVETSIPFR
jgi:hypothetical protein